MRGKVAVAVKTGAHTVLTMDEEMAVGDADCLTIGRDELKGIVCTMCNGGRWVPWKQKKGPGLDRRVPQETPATA